ncbi:copper resistance protein NlpE N-terminal domain-containing protein [Flavobacterium oreochromis]|nr:copper resistance protein NlpE N-terminal domain-containing protein [Flavobacterium oreochromis]
MEVELVLNSNKTFLYNNLYLSQDNHAYKDKGTYTINNDTLILQKGKEQTHFLIGQDKLTLLDLNKKLIKGNFASYYILNKQKKYDYAGRYDIFYNSNENYKQTVSISPEKISIN